jgi:hypothetical protein
MTTRAKTARRQVNGFINRKVAPIMTNGSVHSDKINGDRKVKKKGHFICTVKLYSRRLYQRISKKKNMLQVCVQWIIIIMQKRQDNSL